VDRDLVFKALTTHAQAVLDQRNELEPDLPRPVVNGAMDLSNVDSFSVVELVLDLESELSIPILDYLFEFTGQTLDDFADFIVAKGEARERDTSTGGR
jgi:acyl carrier protein